MAKKITFEIVDTGRATSEPEAHSCKVCMGDGRMRIDFETIDDVRTWLSCPMNHHDSALFIIKWAGSMPTVNRTTALDLGDDGLMRAVLEEHMRRRHDPRVCGVEREEEHEE